MNLASVDPAVAPVIVLKLLDKEEDVQLILKGANLQRRILDAPALAAYRGKPLYPLDQADQVAVLADIRNRADTEYHPGCTCKMGDDPMAVVDAQLRVHGVARLRVVDASIMPKMVAGNTNAPTIMIAEKTVDLIRAAH